MTDKCWHLTRIGVASAWREVFKAKIDPERPAWAAVEAFDWDDVRVAHLDHGYTKHPATRRAIRSALGWNFMEDGPDARDPMDYDQTAVGFPGHGTRTGSVLAGLDPDFGYLGVAPGVPLVPYRVTNRSVLELPQSGPGESECGNIARAIRHAVDTRGCQVISISLGAVFGHRHMGEAIDHAYRNGVIVVAAAGQELHKVVYPAKYRQTIAAGGFDSDFDAYQRYDGHAQPDIWAPAVGVLRADTKLPDRDPHDHFYHRGDGTSYATAVIAGLAALFVRRYRRRLETYQGWRRVELFRALLPRGSRTVDHDTALRGVQFGPIFADGFGAWPTPKALKEAEIKAGSMRF